MSALLNIGCGATFHSAWTNLDARPLAPEVVPHDVRAGLPFPENRFQAVYASHVLEHLAPEAGLRLLRECHRVLRPDGIARIVVPDLETIARTYLQCLEGASKGDAQAEERYDWMMLELYDQAVRTASGGAMAACLEQPHSEAQRRFIAGRVGDAHAHTSPGPSSFARRARRASRNARVRAAQACAYALLRGEGAAALQEGLFRRSGEVHQWMYDRFSISRALKKAGFADVATRAADESAIEGFPRYGLETAGGRARKPDSLYVEGRKPQA
jgi:predicted SAM-dependent methyltransferase